MVLFSINQLPSELQAEITWQTVKTGQTVFREGEPADFLFFVENGQIRLLQYTSTGKEVDHYRVQAGEFFSEVVLFLETYACTAIAAQSSRIGCIPKSIFMPILRQNSDLSIALMAQVARRLHSLKILLELRSIRTARERVLRYFQIMIPLVVEPNQNSIILTRPLKEIAGNLGMSPEAFSRALKQLQEAGAITRVGRRITLHER